MRLRVVRRGRWQLLAVCRDRGDCPLLDFLNGLPSNLQKDARRLQALFDRVEEHGPPRNVEVSHHIGDQLWEFIRGRLRAIWFSDEGRVVILTHGLVKKSRTTPRAEIERAEDWRTAYLQAKRKGRLIIEEDG